MELELDMKTIKSYIVKATPLIAEVEGQPVNTMFNLFTKKDIH